MNHSKIILIALCLLVIGFSTNCGTKASKNLTTIQENTKEENTSVFDFGNIENHTYTNDFFGFKIPYHTDWNVQDQEQMKHMVKMGHEIVAGDDESFKSLIKASEVNSAYLFTVFEHEVGTPVDFNSSFMAMAENVSYAPGIKRGEDYLLNVKRILKMSQLDYTFDEEIYEEKLDDVVFDVMKAYTKAGDIEITQIYYSIIKKGFSLCFITSYNTKEQKTKLESMIADVQMH